MNDEGETPHVGSLGEEATKLLGALSGWAREHVGEVNDHLATGSAECTWCPICRAVHSVRELSPEVALHLATAATALANAATAFMAATGESSAASSDLEFVDLDQNWPDDD